MVAVPKSKGKVRICAECMPGKESVKQTLAQLQGAGCSLN